MKPRAVYRKTFAFVLLKLLTHLVCAAVSAVFLLFVYISCKNSSKPLFILMGLLFWVLVTVSVVPVIDKLGGHYVKSGHVAAIAALVRTGCLDRPVRTGVCAVKERFPVTTAYYFVHNLVSGAVRQLQKALLTAVGDISFLVGLGSFQKAAYRYLQIAAGSIDRCCLAYTYGKPKLGPVQAACDGVVIYAANWKEISKEAGKAMFWSTALGAVFVIVPAVAVIVALLSVQSAGIWIVPLLAFSAYLATGVKTAVVDSYVTCRMVCVFQSLANDTELPKSYYDELASMSGKFRKLLSAAKKERRQTKNGKKQKTPSDPKIVWQKV